MSNNRKFTLKYSILLGSSALLLALSGCGDNANKHASTPTALISAKNIRADMLFLADDTLKGRDTGSPEYDIAANFVANRMAHLGLKPLPGMDGFHQRFHFTKSKVTDASMKIEGMEDETTLQQMKDFMAQPVFTESSIGLNNVPVVYAGYGIYAPGLGYNDYANLDVRDKIVAILNGTPDSFATNERAYYNQRGKIDSLNAMGAIGVIFLPSEKDIKAQSFEKSAKWGNAQRLRWTNPDGNVDGATASLQFGFVFSANAAHKLFSDETHTFEGLETTLKDKNNGGFELLKTISFKVDSDIGQINSQNIAGMLPGSDPAVADQYVIYSAHLDHKGTHCRQNKADLDDHICNGAYDNASGVATILENARVMSMLEKAPRRPVVFLAVAGEEMGLLGSDYFARNTPAIMRTAIADINLDMPLFIDEATGIAAIGEPHSTMGAEHLKAAKEVGLTAVEDPFPEETLFVRSDHYSFVRQGVPSLLIVNSYSPQDANPSPQALYSSFLSNQYHTVMDDLSLPFHAETARNYGRYALQMGLNIANQQSVPKWKDGDFFGDLFKRK